MGRRGRSSKVLGYIALFLVLMWLGKFLEQYWVLIVVLLMLAGIWAMVYLMEHPEARERWSRPRHDVGNIPIEVGSSHSAYRGGGMSGIDFESYCAEILRMQGYSDIRLTKASGDQGVDITARRGGQRWAFQCKHYSQPVGNKAVQEVYAGAAIYGCDRAVVMTNSTFTSGAKEAARRTGVELWERI